jgi:hypothetical protein
MKDLVTGRIQGFRALHAEASRSSELEERPGHGSDRGFCALQARPMQMSCQPTRCGEV